jgi:hypothetical protein
MRNATCRNWLKWRIAPASTVPSVPMSRCVRVFSSAGGAGGDTGEQPGPDGIRHELVARIRREIAAGTYDTEEKWLAAEAELLRRMEERS